MLCSSSVYSKLLLSEIAVPLGFVERGEQILFLHSSFDFMANGPSKCMSCSSMI